MILCSPLGKHQILSFSRIEFHKPLAGPRTKCIKIFVYLGNGQIFIAYKNIKDLL